MLLRTINRLYLVPPHVGRELVERWAAIFRAADTLIDVLDRTPATGLHVLPQLAELVLAGLVIRTHTGIKSTTHVL
jgi:hypothetical protein